jgi:hypothetical protein
MEFRPHRLFCATLGLVLIGCGGAVGQAGPPDAPVFKVEDLKAAAQQVSQGFEARIVEVARSLQSEPNLKNLSEQQRVARVEFVLGNTFFILLHEMGHVHISEMKLPVLGREENEADTFAAITMLRVVTDFSERVLTNASQGWFLNGRRDTQTGAMPAYYDEHDVSPQRAYQVVCLMVGSDPIKFKHLADDAKMPESRQQSCKHDYEKALRGWNTVLAPYRRAADQPETKINVVYGDAQGMFAPFARAFRETRILETVAQRAAAVYTWPAPFTLQMLSCDGPNASWDDEKRTLTICYQLAFDFAQLYQAYVQAPPPAAPVVAAKQKRSNKSSSAVGARAAPGR